MKLIRSKGIIDSGIACLAMVTDRDFQGAHELMGRNVYQGKPVILEELKWVMFLSGIAHYTYRPSDDTTEVPRLSGDYVLPMPADLDAMADERTALVEIIRRSHDRKLSHFIVVHKGQLFDPVGYFEELPWKFVSLTIVRPVSRTEPTFNRSPIFNRKMMTFADRWKFVDRPLPDASQRRFRGSIGEPIESEPPPNAKYPWGLMRVGDCVEILINVKREEQDVNTFKASMSMFGKEKNKRFMARRGLDDKKRLVLWVWRIF